MLLIFSLLFILYYFVWFYGIYHYRPVEALVINYLWPMILYLTHTKFFGDRGANYFVDIPVLAVAFLGVSFIVFSGRDVSADTDESEFALSFVAAVLPAIYFGILRYSEEKTYFSKSAALKLSSIIGFVLCSAGAIATLSIEPLAEAKDYFPAFIMGILSISIANKLFAEAADGTNTAFLSSVSYFSPVIAVVLMSFFIDGRIPGGAWFGIVLVIVSNVLTSRLLVSHVQLLVVAVCAFYMLSWIYVRQALDLTIDVSIYLASIPAFFALFVGITLPRLMDRRSKISEKFHSIVFFVLSLQAEIDELDEPRAGAVSRTVYKEFLEYVHDVVRNGARTESRGKISIFSQEAKTALRSLKAPKVDEVAYQAEKAAAECVYLLRPTFGFFEIFALVLSAGATALAAIGASTDPTVLAVVALLSFVVFSIVGRVIHINYFGNEIVSNEFIRNVQLGKFPSFLNPTKNASEIPAAVAHNLAALDAGPNSDKAEVEALERTLASQRLGWRIVATFLNFAIFALMWLLVIEFVSDGHF